MKKTIKIGGKEFACEVTGLTPVVYRETFSKDIFIELGEQLDLVEQGKGEEVDQTIFSRMAFVFTGAAEKGENYREWLKGFGLYDFQAASGDIIDFWQSGLTTLDDEGDQKNVATAGD